jgi:CheY-like chemotaxis protein
VNDDNCVLPPPCVPEPSREAVAMLGGDEGVVHAQIVIIEDEPVLRATFTHLLRKQGYRVCAAEDGIEGVKICHELNPDLVITDLLMPGQDGMATITILRRAFPTLPIVAVSAVMGNQNHRRCMKLGATRCISKPVRADELVRVVRELFDTGEQMPKA